MTIKLYRKVKLSQFRFSRFSTEKNNNETSDKPEDHLIRALANTAAAAAGQWIPMDFEFAGLLYIASECKNGNWYRINEHKSCDQN